MQKREASRVEFQWPVALILVTFLIVTQKGQKRKEDVISVVLVW